MLSARKFHTTMRALRLLCDEMLKGIGQPVHAEPVTQILGGCIQALGPQHDDRRIIGGAFCEPAIAGPTKPVNGDVQLQR